MKYLVLSDIHANLEALDAVLASAERYDRVLVLGDLVGYGADPNAVIDRVRELPVHAMIRGNHDKVAARVEGVEGFNQLAREAIMWTTARLTPANLKWLAALPVGPMMIDDLIEICHGTPFDEDVYVFDDLDALRALRSAERPLCLYGHTHVAAVFRLTETPNGQAGLSESQAVLELIGPARQARFGVEVDPRAQYLVNCGAVGQPRDGDPRAAYGIVDTDGRTVTIVRVPYDIGGAQTKIIQAGLPEILAHRLALGR